jgi:hypothetical protein
MLANRGNKGGKAAMEGHRGPHVNKEGHLPRRDAAGNPITYEEYDLGHHGERVVGDVGPNRLIVGSDGNVYITNTHYGEGGAIPPFYYLGKFPGINR